MRTRNKLLTTHSLWLILYQEVPSSVNLTPFSLFTVSHPHIVPESMWIICFHQNTPVHTTTSYILSIYTILFHSHGAESHWFDLTELIQQQGELVLHRKFIHLINRSVDPHFGPKRAQSNLVLLSPITQSRRAHHNRPSWKNNHSHIENRLKWRKYQDQKWLKSSKSSSTTF